MNYINVINSQLQQYKSKLDKYKETLNTEQINPDLIKQNLVLGNEPTAIANYEILGNNSNLFFQESYPNDPTTFWIEGENLSSLTGSFFKVTWDNLKNSSYRGNRISKMTAVFSDLMHDNGNKENHNAMLLISKNPYRGMSYIYSSSITAEYTLYDETGNIINLPDDASSWITIGSLNAGNARQEGASLLSAGKVYGFKDSSVTVHDGNTLYSDKANDFHTIIGGDWKDTTTIDQSQYSWGTDNWDTGLDSDHAYYGAGVFNIEGGKFKIKFFTNRSEQRNVKTWVTISTSIVKSNSGITPPEIHYNYTNVALLC